MLHLDVNRSGREADYLLTCSVERMTNWCHTSTPKHTFIAFVMMTSLYVLRHFLQQVLCDIPTPAMLLICGRDLDCGLLRCGVQCGTVQQNVPCSVIPYIKMSRAVWYRTSKCAVQCGTVHQNVPCRLVPYIKIPNPIPSHSTCYIQRRQKSLSHGIFFCCNMKHYR
jgi:hypothetical protein